MSKFLLITIFSLSVFLVGCAPSADNGSDTFTVEEISAHNSASSCWMIISNKVYDVTAFISRHPGGGDILLGCGKDATELFETQNGSGDGHSQGAESMLKQYYIGDLAM